MGRRVTLGITIVSFAYQHHDISSLKCGTRRNNSTTRDVSNHAEARRAVRVDARCTTTNNVML